jgi:hypothetical protein
MFNFLKTLFAKKQRASTAGSPSIINIRSNKISWEAVATLVNQHSSKTYARYYIRDVALGLRVNRTILGILSEVGVMREIRRGIA